MTESITNPDYLTSDTGQARCSGLINGSAKKKSNNEIVSAEIVHKDDGPFYCPDCFSEAVVRKCVEKVDHFAHKARLSPILQEKNRKFHDECVLNIKNLLAQAFPEGKWERERAIEANEKKDAKRDIPDLSGRIDKIPIAIEVQLSPYTINRIANKSIEYYKHGVTVLWLIPLRTDLGEEPFRPRLFEKYLHSMYYGRVYYWLPTDGTLITPVHFSPSKRWIEESSWYESNGEERVEGGYYKTYRTIKKPNFGTQVDIVKDFKKVIRDLFEPENGRKAIPQCNIYQDILPTWWDKNEFLDKDSQFEVAKGEDSVPNVEYDDYDTY